MVFLTGPRQSGKTTLARAAFPEFSYISLEDLQNREEASEDPRAFLRRLDGTKGAVLDEVQRVPDLFSYLKGFIDEQRGGPLVLTGSPFSSRKRPARLSPDGPPFWNCFPFPRQSYAGARPLPLRPSWSPPTPSKSLTALTFTKPCSRVFSRGSMTVIWTHPLGLTGM